MGHYYSEMFPDEQAKTNAYFSKRDKVIKAIENKSLSEFTVKQIRVLIKLYLAKLTIEEMDELLQEAK